MWAYRQPHFHIRHYNWARVLPDLVLQYSLKQNAKQNWLLQDDVRYKFDSAAGLAAIQLSQANSADELAVREGYAMVDLI